MDLLSWAPIFLATRPKEVRRLPRSLWHSHSKRFGLIAKLRPISQPVKPLVPGFTEVRQEPPATTIETKSLRPQALS